jgi:hypothetical protein
MSSTHKSTYDEYCSMSQLRGAKAGERAPHEQAAPSGRRIHSFQLVIL